MAVSSCKSYDEAASWRSEDDVVNLTNTAANAGDFSPNQHLDENCNNNNNKQIYAFDTTKENFKISGISDRAQLQIDVIETKKTESLSKNLANLNSCKNTRLCEDNLPDKTLMGVDENKMKLLEVAVNCPENMENDKNIHLSSELTSEINKVKEDVSETEKNHSINMSIPQDESTATVEVDQQAPNQTNKEEDNHSVNTEEEEIRDPDWTEERFRVDRRKLEQMLQGEIFHYHTSNC